MVRDLDATKKNLCAILTVATVIDHDNVEVASIGSSRKPARELWPAATPRNPAPDSFGAQETTREQTYEHCADIILHHWVEHTGTER